MLFDPKHQGKIKIVWGALCILIIIAMVLTLVPAFFM